MDYTSLAMFFVMSLGSPRSSEKNVHKLVTISPPTQAFLGKLVERDELQAPLKTPAWEASKNSTSKLGFATVTVQ